jgi:hypothetical protein
LVHVKGCYEEEKAISISTYWIFFRMCSHGYKAIFMDCMQFRCCGAAGSRGMYVSNSSIDSSAIHPLHLVFLCICTHTTTRKFSKENAHLHASARFHDFHLIPNTNNPILKQRHNLHPQKRTFRLRRNRLSSPHQRLVRLVLILDTRVRIDIR